MEYAAVISVAEAYRKKLVDQGVKSPKILEQMVERKIRGMFGEKAIAYIPRY